MAQRVDLPAIPPFSVHDQTTLSQRWAKWRTSLEYFIAASGIADKKQQRAVLLHLAGPEVQEIFETFEDTGTEYDHAITKLNAYFEPKKNVPFERQQFRQAIQGPGELMDTFVTRLRKLAQTCEFGNAKAMIWDQALDKCRSGKLRRRLLREPALTLDQILTIARATEAADLQAEQMEAGTRQPPQINAISRVGITQLHFRVSGW